MVLLLNMLKATSPATRRCPLVISLIIYFVPTMRVTGRPVSFGRSGAPAGYVLNSFLIEFFFMNFRLL
jgi:hypothetical protein